MELIDLAPLLAIPAVGKVIDLYRQFVLERDARKVAFTVGAWLVGTGLVFVVTQSNVGPDLPDLNWADLILAGIGLGASASYVHDFSTRNDIQTVATLPLPSLGESLVITDETVVEVDVVE